jgi:hypothetical protein
MTISQLHPRWVRHVSLACVLALSACGGGGGGSSNNASNAANAQIAAQVADIAPNNDTDTTSVFVKLGNSSAAASGAAVTYSDASRTQLQTQFLEDLKTAVGPKVLLGVSTSPACDTTGFAQQLQNAHQYAADAVVRLDLTACQLNLLPTLPNVQGVYPDITLDHQSFAASNVTSLNNAIDFSFNATPSRQINGKSADGTSVVIAVMDTGVEERHPALGSAKVLPGACFSTASNGGSSFCAGSGNQFIETIEDPNIPGHTRAAHSHQCRLHTRNRHGQRCSDGRHGIFQQYPRRHRQRRYCTTGQHLAYPGFQQKLQQYFRLVRRSVSGTGMARQGSPETQRQ